MNKSEQINELAAALAKAQGAFPTIEKNRSVKMKGVSKSGKEFNVEYKYATLSGIMEAVRKPLMENGLSISHAITTLNEAGALAVDTYLLHSSGQFISSRVAIPDYGKFQELGASISFVRRYSVGGLLGVVSDEDLDEVGADLASDAVVTEGGKVVADSRPASLQLKKPEWLK